MDFNDKLKSVKEKINQLKEYREQLEFYKTNKDAFEKAQNSIELDDNVAFFSPLNDFDNHLEEKQKSLSLVYDNKGFMTFRYFCYGILISLIIIGGILIANFIRSVWWILMLLERKKVFC